MGETTARACRRAALVTGGARGLGLAIARVLAEEGHDLTLADRLEPELAAAVERLAAEGHEAHGAAGDLRDEEQVRRVVAAHAERYGRLDVLVNNAGVSIPTPLETLEAKRIDLLLGVNLRAPILFYRECAPLLRAAGAEHGNALVVNLSSVSGKQGVAGLSVYSAAKAGLVAFTEAMNKELAAWGVKSTALCPAAVDTPMTDAVKDRVPAESMMRPEDVAESVRYLLRTSPRCVVPEIVTLLPGQSVGDSG